jgi:predicted secreted protein with PEFG-CTERM motif
MVHPWMLGVVTVQGETMGEGEDEMMESEETYASAMSSDGSVNVDIESGIPAAGEEMTINVTFTDADGNAIQHANYDITATQDGTGVLSESGMHEHAGEGTHVTDALASDSPVDIQVTILGIGLPDDEVNWSGPIGDVISLQVVPEFGTIAALVLAISIVSIIAVTAKSRVIPKL